MDYVQTLPKADIDESLLDDLRREMTAVVPEIVETIRRREEFAAYLRGESRRTVGIPESPQIYAARHLLGSVTARRHSRQIPCFV